MSFCSSASSAIYAGLVVFTAITIDFCYGGQWEANAQKAQPLVSVHDLAIAFAFADPLS